MKWLLCELRCYAYLLRNLHRMRAANRGGILLRVRPDGGFEFATWRGKRGGWAGFTVAEGLTTTRKHHRIRRNLRGAFAEDPMLRPRYSN